VAHVYCQECGFQNPESSNYCARCGALLVKDDGVETTQTFTPDEGEPSPADALDDLGVKGPALVVRSGGGRAGETFPLDAGQTTIGRSPDCGIFLDDVTVSRKHAVLTRRGAEFSIEDQGSLNGTFVNRRRIESGALEDGDEVQIGKYRLTFLDR
jgi:pSer/pThr/pTyr-binding forkhead associated (FHA) protein